MEGKNLKKSAYVEKLEMLRKKLSEYENIYAQSNGSSISRYNLNSANFESIESAIAKRIKTAPMINIIVLVFMITSF